MLPTDVITSSTKWMSHNAARIIIPFLKLIKAINSITKKIAKINYRNNKKKNYWTRNDFNPRIFRWFLRRNKLLPRKKNKLSAKFNNSFRFKKFNQTALKNKNCVLNRHNTECHINIRVKSCLIFMFLYLSFSVGQRLKLS